MRALTAWMWVRQGWDFAAASRNNVLVRNQRLLYKCTASIYGPKVSKPAPLTLHMPEWRIVSDVHLLQLNYANNEPELSLQ